MLRPGVSPSKTSPLLSSSNNPLLKLNTKRKIGHVILGMGLLLSLVAIFVVYVKYQQRVDTFLDIQESKLHKEEEYQEPQEAVDKYYPSFHQLKLMMRKSQVADSAPEVNNSSAYCGYSNKMDFGYPLNGMLRPDQSDRLSISNFKLLGELNYLQVGSLQPSEYTWAPRLEKYIHCMRPGTVIITDAYSVEKFFNEMLPEIQVPITLITTDGDGTSHSAALWRIAEESDKILAWFYHNSDLEVQYYNRSSKLFPIPLGMAQWGETQKHITQFTEKHVMSFDEFGKPEFDLEKVRLESGDPSVLMSFSIWPWRKPVWDMFCNDSSNRTDLKAVATCLQTQPYEDRIQNFAFYAKHDFAVSPIGFGLDCYRTYESIYQGIIPIVQSTTLDPIYEDLPVVVVKDWNDLNVPFLKSKLEDPKLMQSNEAFLRLYMSYWKLLAWSRRSGEAKFVRYIYD